ncbi:MAG: hypothetical protein U0359_36525 [Byssovorax sp.]
MRSAHLASSITARRVRGLVASSLLLGGAGLAGAAGCSDPVPPTPQGAFQVTFVSDSAECGIAGHNTAVGAVTSTTKDKVLVSGTEGADVECTVSGSGTFSVQAKITQNGQGLEINIPKLTASASKDNPATGSVNYASLKTSGTAFSSATDTPCKFYFTSSSEGVASGRVWITFDCPKIVQGTMKTCKLGPGFAIFENCAE